jgi:hypothetical protein
MFPHVFLYIVSLSQSDYLSPLTPNIPLRLLCIILDLFRSVFLHSVLLSQYDYVSPTGS